MEDLNFIARQLRKPSGEFAVKIAKKMNEVNRPLYDLALESIQFQDHDSILEIGFGSGTHFPDLLAKAKDLRVNGIDYSPEMTNLAAASNKSAAESGHLKLYTANSNQLPFDDSSFDTVFCNMVIYFWDDPVEHLREVHRVQKTGGTFYTGMRTRESMVQFPFTKFGFNLYGVEEWKTILRSNGFIVSDEFRKKDPVFDDDGKRIQLESVCIAANTYS